VDRTASILVTALTMASDGYVPVMMDVGVAALLDAASPDGVTDATWDDVTSLLGGLGSLLPLPTGPARRLLALGVRE
jgi:hypothetical protein